MDTSMNTRATAEKPGVAYPAGGSTWIEIIFTLDPETYKQLWSVAEERQTSVSIVVRETVVDFLARAEADLFKKELAVNMAVGN